MEERSVPTGPAERPIAPSEPSPPSQGPAHLADPRALTILTTEHWSLLTARSLVYNEAFSRAGMFLTFLTGTLVALGFVSQGTGYGREFLIVAAALLGFDLFIGLATLGRISSASAEEFRALQGMNRLRHAYLEMVPDLRPYISSSDHDDLQSVLSIYGPEPDPNSPTDVVAPILGNIAHGFTTTPGMIGTITAAVGGAFAATVVLILGAPPMVGVVAGLAGFGIMTALILAAAFRGFLALEHGIRPRFPSPKPDRDR